VGMDRCRRSWSLAVGLGNTEFCPLKDEPEIDLASRLILSGQKKESPLPNNAGCFPKRQLNYTGFGQAITAVVRRGYTKGLSGNK
jgi:hypothetical protein